MQKVRFIMHFDVEGSNLVILLSMFVEFAVLRRMQLFVRSLSFRTIRELSEC